MILYKNIRNTHTLLYIGVCVYAHICWTCVDACFLRIFAHLRILSNKNE